MPTPYQHSTAEIDLLQAAFSSLNVPRLEHTGLTTSIADLASAVEKLTDFGNEILYKYRLCVSAETSQSHLDHLRETILIKSLHVVTLSHRPNRTELQSDKVIYARFLHPATSDGVHFLHAGTQYKDEESGLPCEEVVKIHGEAVTYWSNDVFSHPLTDKNLPKAWQTVTECYESLIMAESSFRLTVRARLDNTWVSVPEMKKVAKEF